MSPTCAKQAPSASKSARSSIPDNDVLFTHVSKHAPSKRPLRASQPGRRSPTTMSYSLMSPTCERPLRASQPVPDNDVLMQQYTPLCVLRTGRGEGREEAGEGRCGLERASLLHILNQQRPPLERLGAHAPRQPRRDRRRILVCKSATSDHGGLHQQPWV